MYVLRAMLVFVAVFGMLTVVLMGCEKQMPLIDPIMGTGNSDTGSTTDDTREYRPGTVVVQYDQEAWEMVSMEDIPIAPVNILLVNLGYTPVVLTRWEHFREVIYLGEDVLDLLPILQLLQTVPGVVGAEFNFIDPEEFITPCCAWNGDPSSDE
ncbi:hypothetical protein C6501_10805 [Candidatus Poribacteria bacterium]|nr:MAG: hypothetical protein C6501_10805 [Candidatus Poribacteria bacterium]